MLFSRKDLADYINNTFEPAWETVRSVPMVWIDFGNGQVLTRTLQGNIATYVCNADGYVLDVLPCIYDPAGYRKGLEQLSTVASIIGQQPDTRKAIALANYHSRALSSLDSSPSALQPAPTGLGFGGGGGAGGGLGGGMGGVPNAGFGNGPVQGPLAGGGGKLGIEGGLKNQLASPRLASFATASNLVQPVAPVEQVPPLDSAEDLADWKALRLDTRLNETVRRRQIHALLAGRGLVRPGEIAKLIYKEVLHADLDDPYLGLGSVLFANYPFTREDKH